MVACWLWLFRLAVTIAFWLVPTVPEAAAKVAVLWPDATMVLAGTVSNALLLVSDTVAALVAALLKVTVQVLDALLAKVKGPHVSELSCTAAGAVALSVNDCETLLRLAVRRAL